MFLLQLGACTETMKQRGKTDKKVKMPMPMGYVVPVFDAYTYMRPFLAFIHGNIILSSAQGPWFGGICTIVMDLTRISKVSTPPQGELIPQLLVFGAVAGFIVLPPIGYSAVDS